MITNELEFKETFFSYQNVFPKCISNPFGKARTVRQNHDKTNLGLKFLGQVFSKFVQELECGEVV